MFWKSGMYSEEAIWVRRVRDKVSENFKELALT